MSYINKYLGYNRFSEAVALAALDSDEHYRRVADDMEWGRQLYKKEFGDKPGFKVYKSVANFGESSLEWRLCFLGEIDLKGTERRHRL